MPTHQKKRRALVLGIDGMTWSAVLPFVEEGLMPTVKGLMDEGAWGVMRSVVPPVTGAAWTSITTGKQPANHGVFHFVKTYRNSEREPMVRRLVRSNEIDAKTIWQILGEHGRRSIVLNIPISYPAQEINGVMMACMLSPAIDGQFSRPDGIIPRLKPELGEYVITTNWQRYSDETARQFIRDAIFCEQQRTKYCIRLMEENPDWDLCFPCFTELDQVEHGLWCYFDPNDREELKRTGKYDPEIMDLLREFHRELDNNIAALLHAAGIAPGSGASLPANHEGPSPTPDPRPPTPETAVFFVSDHGFGSLYGRFMLNNFLMEKGLLAIDRRRMRRAKVALLMKKVWFKFLKTVGLQKIVRDYLTKKAMERPMLDLMYEAIDWSKTKAYMATNVKGGLHLNVKGRRIYGTGPDIDQGCIAPADYEKVREEVIEVLRDIRHPDTGKPMLSHLALREEVYQGKYAEYMPDIVFFLDGGEWVTDAGLGHGTYQRANWRIGSGTHRMEGCFLAWGPGIRRNPNLETENIHAAPTILVWLGLPIPEDMDGKVAAEVFTDADRPPAQAVAASGRTPLSEGQEGC